MEKTHMHPRKLARMMARSTLDQSKITGYNKERTGHDGKKLPSLFARKWRELSMQKVQISVKRKKARK